MENLVNQRGDLGGMARIHLLRRRHILSSPHIYINTHKPNPPPLVCQPSPSPAHAHTDAELPSPFPLCIPTQSRTYRAYRRFDTAFPDDPQCLLNIAHTALLGQRLLVQPHKRHLCALPAHHAQSVIVSLAAIDCGFRCTWVEPFEDTAQQQAGPHVVKQVGERHTQVQRIQPPQILLQLGPPCESHRCVTYTCIHCERKRKRRDGRSATHRLALGRATPATRAAVATRTPPIRSIPCRCSADPHRRRCCCRHPYCYCHHRRRRSTKPRTRRPRSPRTAPVTSPSRAVLTRGCSYLLVAVFAGPPRALAVTAPPRGAGRVTRHLLRRVESKRPLRKRHHLVHNFPTRARRQHSHCLSEVTLCGSAARRCTGESGWRKLGLSWRASGDGGRRASRAGPF